MSKPKPSRWLNLFETFVEDLRIKSKEINSNDQRGSKLEMWDSQRRFLKEVGQGLDDGIHRFNILKSRQLGITTISLAIDVFWLAVHENIIGCLVTDTEKNREANRALIQHYVESFPEDYFGEKFAITGNNRSMMTFSNGCRLDLLVAGVRKKPIAWGQGQGYSFCHSTETGNYGDPEGLKSLEEGFAQENPDRLYIFESTANGFNHWRTRYYAGLEDTYNQRSVFIGWWAGDTNKLARSDPRFLQYGREKPDNEEREKIRAVAKQYQHTVTQEQLAWIRWKEHAAGSEQDLFLQNQPWTAEEAFVSTGYSFFATRTIGEDLKRLDDERRPYKGYRYHVDGDFFTFSMEELEAKQENVRFVELKVWDEPDPVGRYVIGFDPAYGRTNHGDYHVISVWRCFADRMVQVAEYRCKDVEAKHASWVLFHLCAAYGDCMANVELNGPGRLVMTEFNHLRELLAAEMNKEKVKDRNWENAALQARWFLYKKVDSSGGGYALNFEASWRTSKELMYAMRGAYVSGEIEIWSRVLLQEMQNVVVVDDHIGAPESQNEDMKDDSVFAASLAIRAWTEWVRREMLVNGQTYEVVMNGGNQKPDEQRVNGIVRRFLLTQEEKANMPVDNVPKWKRDYGLA